MCIGGIAFGALRGVQASRAAVEASYAESHAPGPSRTESRAVLQEKLRAAVFLGRQGEFDAALERLRALADAYPGEASIWLNLGIAYTGRGELDEAERAFQKVLEISPNDWDGMAEMANLALDRGNLEAALGYAERIPPGKGRMSARLARDERWRENLEHPRVMALRKKHGMAEAPGQAERLEQELSSRRLAAREERVRTERLTPEPVNDPDPSPRGADASATQAPQGGPAVPGPEAEPRPVKNASEGAMQAWDRTEGDAPVSTPLTAPKPWGFHPSSR